MSSREQIVIPKNMRKNFKWNEEIILLEIDGEIILKNKKEISEKLSNEINFKKGFEEAYKGYYYRDCISIKRYNFIKIPVIKF